MCPHIFFTLATSIILIYYSQHLATTLPNSMVAQAFLSCREISDSPHLPLTISQCQKIIKELRETLNTLKAFSGTLYGSFLFGDIRNLINLLDRQMTLLEVRLEPLAGESETNHYGCQAHTRARIRRHSSWPNLSHRMHHSSFPPFAPTPVTDKSWHPHDSSTRQGSSAGRGGVIGGIHLNFNNGGNVSGLKYDYMEVEDYSKNTRSRGIPKTINLAPTMNPSITANTPSGPHHALNNINGSLR
ncbi:hypothetical protein BJ165DRAFT_1596470 [Panaeolus papilionaceus]|nr:hypothetical protein BJ165DRAFT_1596470 [Panaeolus papilionaceus]